MLLFHAPVDRCWDKKLSTIQPYRMMTIMFPLHSSPMKSTFVNICLVHALHNCMCSSLWLHALSNVIPFSARWMNGKKKVIDAVNASKTQIQFILIIFSYCQFIPSTTRLCFVISEMRLCRWKAMMISRALKRLWLSEILMILVACRVIWFLLSSPASSPDWSYRIESSNLMQLIPTLLALPPHRIVNERSAVRAWRALD